MKLKAGEYVERVWDAIKDHPKAATAVGAIAIYLGTCAAGMHDWLGIKEITQYAYDRGPWTPDVNDADSDRANLDNDHDGLNQGLDDLNHAVTDIQNDVNYLNQSHNDSVGPVEPVVPATFEKSFGFDKLTLTDMVREHTVSDIANILGIKESVLRARLDGEGANGEFVDNNGYVGVATHNADGSYALEMNTMNGVENLDLTNENAETLYDLASNGGN